MQNTMDQIYVPAVLLQCTIMTARSTTLRESSVSENEPSEEEPRFTPATPFVKRNINLEGKMTKLIKSKRNSQN